MMNARVHPAASNARLYAAVSNVCLYRLFLEQVMCVCTVHPACAYPKHPRCPPHVLPPHTPVPCCPPPALLPCPLTCPWPCQPCTLIPHPPSPSDQAAGVPFRGDDPSPQDGIRRAPGAPPPTRTHARGLHGCHPGPHARCRSSCQPCQVTLCPPADVAPPQEARPTLRQPFPREAHAGTSPLCLSDPPCL